MFDPRLKVLRRLTAAEKVEAEIHWKTGNRKE
jgi:hypothetical protein